MNHSIRSALTALGLLFLVHAAQAQTSGASLAGRVYPDDAAGLNPIFMTQRFIKTTTDTRVLTERVQDLEGNTAALLESTYVAGVLQSIVFEQNQSKASASAVFKDGRVFFTSTENGSTKKSDQAVDGNWVSLSAVPDEITKNWDTVTDGTPLEFVMPVPIMRDHFAFKVTQQRVWTDNGKRLREFKMQASSILIRMVADAFYYVFDDDNRTLVEYRGVTMTKTMDNGKLKDLKARITYSPLALAVPVGK